MILGEKKSPEVTKVTEIAYKTVYKRVNIRSGKKSASWGKKKG